MEHNRHSSDGLAEPVLSFEQAEGIAAEVGTPFLALSPGRLRHNVAELRDALPNVELFYAMKSNPHLDVLVALDALVDGIDVASWGEARVAERAGYGPERLLHTNPVKTPAEIQRCLDHGIRWFVFDSRDEMQKLSEFGDAADLLLRMAIPDATCTVDLSSKFGVQPGDVPVFFAQAKRLGLPVRGISFHVGSQCREPADFERAFGLVRRAFQQGRRAGFALDTLDIGGGLPVPYRTTLPRREEYFAAIRRGLNRFRADRLRVLAEPGRCIAGDAMTLVVSVIGRATRNGHPWYYVDDGLYGAFSGKLYDHCDYRLLTKRAGPPGDCVVAGRTCDSIDIVARDQPLPALELNDLLLVPGMGAYTGASATMFNGFPPPQVVLLTETRRPMTSDAVAAIGPEKILVAGGVEEEGLYRPAPAPGSELLPLE